MLAIIDTGDLVELAWTSAAAGIGVTAAFGAAILGAARAMDYGREGRPIEAVAYGALGVVATAVVAGAIVFGLLVMTDK
jgi:hypothetical protein